MLLSPKFWWAAKESLAMEANLENKCTLQSGFFTWLVSQEACLTLETLQKNRFHLCSRCYLCVDKPESINHLFLHCQLKDQLEQLFLNMVGLSWSIRGVLVTYWNVGASEARIPIKGNGGKPLQLAYGRRFGGSETLAVLKIKDQDESVYFCFIFCVTSIL